MAQIYYLPLNLDKCERAYADMISLMQQDKREAIEKKAFASDRYLSLYAHILALKKASEALGKDKGKIKILSDGNGKPYVEGGDGFYFSISHTDTAVVVGISGKEIGVDIEKIADAKEKIASRFFTLGEEEHIKKAGTSEAFYEIWTKKEAYIKHSGLGLKAGLKSFDVLSDELKSKFASFKADEYIISAYSEDNEFELIKIEQEDIEK